MISDERDASIRDLQRSLENAILDRNEWKRLAEGLYNYYYLQEGVSTSVREYKNKIGRSNEQ